MFTHFHLGEESGQFSPIEAERVMLYLLLIHLLWHQSEAARNGCSLLPETRTVLCTNISMVEVAASYHNIQVPSTHDCPPIKEDPTIIKCTPSFTNHAPFIRSLVVEDCLHALDEEVGVFFDFPTNLQSARFHRCPLPHIRSSSLTELDLSECGLNEAPHLSHLIGLRKLILSGNRISHLPTTSWWPPSLTELDLTDNRIGENTLKGSLPPTLLSLSLSGNGLSSFYPFPGLRRLNLSRNKIRELNLSLLANLEYLDLRDNLITTLEESYQLPKRIDIRGNPLRCDCEKLKRISNSTTLLHSCMNTNCPSEGVDEEEEVRLVALSSSTVQVQWKNGGGALVYRREDDPPLKMTLVSASPFIHFLNPSTAYIVCVARPSVPPAYTVDQSKCRRVVTLPSSSPPRLLDLSVADTSVRLRWKSDAGGKTEWRIRVKPSGSDSVSTDHRFRSDDGRLHEFVVTDLEPRTDYDVCVEENAAIGGGGSCVKVHTEGEQPRMNPVVGVVVGLCALGLIGAVAIALCRRWRGTHSAPNTEDGIEQKEDRASIAISPFVEEEQTPLGSNTEKDFVEAACFDHKGLKNYARSWSSLRLPHTAPLFCHSPCGYREHLTSVTIYSSGHSEC